MIPNVVRNMLRIVHHVCLVVFFCWSTKCNCLYITHVLEIGDSNLRIFECYFLAKALLMSSKMFSFSKSILFLLLAPGGGGGELRSF